MILLFFFFNDTATTEIYTLSLHDALPISVNRDLDRLAGAGAPPREWLEFDTGMLFLHDNGRFAAIGLKTDSILDALDRKSTRLNSSHLVISYAVFCLKKKNN